MRKILLTINIIIAITLVATAYAGVMNPVSYHYLSLIGFAFPVMAIADAIFIPLWLIIDRPKTVVPVAALAIVWSPLREYAPLNIDREPPEGSIKVMTYNTLGMGMELATPEERERPSKVLDYVIHSGAHIVCLQEYSHLAGQDSLWAIIDSLYAHRDTIVTNAVCTGVSETIALFSKFPIIRKEHIPIYTRGNSLGAFVLDIGGKEVHVVNAHLETVGLSYADKEALDSIKHMKTPLRQAVPVAKGIVRKVKASSMLRAPQADALYAYIRVHQGRSMIVCGDFNDHPLSYVHQTIQSSLTDCHRTAGLGPDFTYPTMKVRIDNILCSNHWKPYRCRVDHSITASDHYPMSTYLSPQ
ncbi:MAG: endonuclease/exonuclease/phosphatase family protein [Prevotella sp.]